MLSRSPIILNAMKAEALYDRMVMGQLITDYIRDIEWNMDQTAASDSYFKGLGLQKFTLEQLLLELNRHKEDSPATIVTRFVERMSVTAKEDDPGFVFSISRDAAQSILDGLYFD